MKQSVLITGCSTGIGRALALGFHQKGYNVWASARDIENLVALRDKGINTVTLDVADPSSRKAALDHIHSKNGCLNILINNAGYGAMGPVIESPESALHKQFETNTFAPIALIREIAPGMIARKGGVIVNVTSVSGILTTPFSGMYCASKAALSALTEALRMELSPFGIDVIDVQPGAIQSNFGDSATKTLSELPEKSIYESINDAIQARAQASQENPSSAEGLAQAVITAVEKVKRPRVVRYGYGSISFPFLAQWLPRGLVHRILQKKFRLNQLG